MHLFPLSFFCPFHFFLPSSSTSRIFTYN
jgi:hypothetical protein